MSKSVVWFTPIQSSKKTSFVTRMGDVLDRAGLADAISGEDKVAIKMHFGEGGNTGFIQPLYIREVVARIKAVGGKPFLTDANTLYSGNRSNGIDHIEQAIHHGFGFATVEAPIVIADGIDGRDSVDVPIAGFDHFDSVRIGAAAVHADAMVVVSHVKGHGETGFGGAFKNVGMGLGCRSAKQRMHSDFRPECNIEKCVTCRRCEQWCPVGAISIPERHPIFDYETCYGCGECVAACSYGAIETQWTTSPEAIQEKIVEHLAGAVANKPGKVIYLSFLTNITPECDCWKFSEAGIVPDIGILASTDPVAIDQAAYDLIAQAPGITGTRGENLKSGDDKFKAINGVDGTRAMEYAEQHGLGSRDYEIKQLG